MIVTNVETAKLTTSRDGAIVRTLVHPKLHGNENQSLAMAELPPGARTELHRHQQGEEVYYILQGRGIITVGQETQEVVPGDCICVHPGRAHRLESTGWEPLKLLCSCSPPYSLSDVSVVSDE